MNRKRRTSTLAAGLAAALLLSGCGARGSDATGTATAAVDPASLVDSLTAGTGDVDQVTWAVVEGEPATLDPGTSAQLITPNLCDNLLTLNPDFSISAGVATSAEFTDPTTLKIDLREDVTFWDGSKLTPEDVVYSLQRGQNPASQWYAAFVLVKDIKVTGAHQVTVTFTAPDLSFRDAISGAAGAVMSKAFGGRVGKSLGTSDGGLMCTGPYELATGAWVPGDSITTTANAEYWGGAPKVKTLKYVFVTDSSTLTTALTTGDIDGAYNVPTTSRSAFESSGAGRLTLGQSTASNSFGPATDEGAAANPKVRLALSYAIDRTQYVDTVMNGLGYVQNTMVAPFAFSHAAAASTYQAGYDDLEAPTKDLDKAKQLLAESGEDLTKPLVLAIPAGATEMQRTAQIIQAAAKEIGVTININEMQAADFGALFYDASGRSGVDFVATTGYIETPSVFGYPSLFTLPVDQGGVFNWSGYSDAGVTSKLQAARTATDAESAAKDFVEAQAIFTPAQLQITLAGAYQSSYLNNDLSGITTSIAIYSSPWALHLGAK
ncbi:ABC transporter substrate-binding protein [Galactobacter valiniphilus]|uniref:ABC transporter substrate-binding protein n=1 Tax=Galactobacter valiniphilus TaxID=2676122 RepID=UPI003734FEF2